MKRQLLSLFCGAGGLDEGFAAAGFETVFAVDNCPDAVGSFNHNAGHEIAIKRDLASLTAEKFLELIPKSAQPIGLIGGPPCQGFSRGNVNSIPNDPRNLLPYRYADLLACANERYGLDFFVFENVAGLLGPKHAQRLGRIVERLRGAGFKVFHHDLDAKAFSVPQRRRRLFVVGLNNKRYADVEFEFPKGNEKLVTVGDVLRHLPTPTFFSRGLLPEQVAHHRNHWTMVPKSEKFKGGTTTDGRSFKRLKWDEVSPTVAYGHREVHVHPDGTRRLSIYEALLLQGFRKEFELVGSLSAQVTQVSNAVPPPLGKAIAEQIARVIEDKQRR
ncbi:MAG: DNA cytosine methyltransferase [Planctomycetota bacterium]|nr:DNA cytosine methyltransferase [Planctomycetota bacterium]